MSELVYDPQTIILTSNSPTLARAVAHEASIQLGCPKVLWPVLPHLVPCPGLLVVGPAKVDQACQVLLGRCVVVKLGSFRLDADWAYHVTSRGGELGELVGEEPLKPAGIQRMATRVAAIYREHNLFDDRQKPEKVGAA